jgi:phosphatidate cytidylyltransferase
MFWTRVISAIVGIPFILGLVYLGKVYFMIAMSILAILAMFELRRMLHRMGRENSPTFLFVGAVLFPVLLYYQPTWLPAFTALLVFSGAIATLGQFPRLNFIDLAIHCLAILYIGLGFAHFVLLRGLEQGMLLVIYGFVVIWCTDSGAYLVGRQIGKRPFFPSISPKKTWEGAIGGLIFGVLGAVAFCYITELYTVLNNKVLLLWLSPLLSCAGQMGDLFESSIKRQARVKDSSRIIPGHGGILDRFDSSLWVIPLLYHCLMLAQLVF